MTTRCGRALPYVYSPSLVGSVCYSSLDSSSAGAYSLAKVMSSELLCAATGNAAGARGANALSSCSMSRWSSSMARPYRSRSVALE